MPLIIPEPDYSDIPSKEVGKVKLNFIQLKEHLSKVMPPDKESLLYNNIIKLKASYIGDFTIVEMDVPNQEYFTRIKIGSGGLLRG